MCARLIFLCRGSDRISREAIQDHPIEVMNYASRHGYPELLDAAAPLTLDIPFDKIADTMSILIMPAWVRTGYFTFPKFPLTHGVVALLPQMESGRRGPKVYRTLGEFDGILPQLPGSYSETGRQRLGERKGEEDDDEPHGTTLAV